MSPRNDMYLSLCLAQAEHSLLHYRHGSIIVRGGKVIGQGFNCYRPGFDGGALKSGVLPSNSLDGSAIVELKQRLKCKWKPGGRSKLDDQQETCTFTPFESMGCGHGTNGPLSMHSEMMAIRSALSLSSGTLSSQTSARSARCFEKPCFKLPGDSKRKRARGRTLKAYAEAVFKEAALPSTGKAYSGKFCIQTSCLTPISSQPSVERLQVQQGRGQFLLRGRCRLEKEREEQEQRSVPVQEDLST